jgi:POT family proton-dependent oligopeptide transporter
LNLFADRYTDMQFFGYEIAAGVFQSVPPFYVFVFAPVFAWFWVWLSDKKFNLTTPVKLSLGLIFMGLGFIVMMGASMVWADGNKAGPSWLFITYLLLTFGEICLYPVGLSAVTKLSPNRLVGQMMGIWFMSLAFGNLMAGLFAGNFDAVAIDADPSVMVHLFWQVAKILLIGGAVVLLISKPVRKWMGEIL